MVRNKSRRNAASMIMKVASVFVVSCMLFALTGCGEQESTATSEVTTEATTQTVTTAPTAEATTEATTATPKPTETTTTPTTEATTTTPKPTETTTTSTTEATTEAPAVTVPDVSDVPQDAQAQAEEWTPEEGENDREPQDPEQPIDDGYWHEDTPSVTAADLQAAAEADLAVFSNYLSNNGWSIVDSHCVRSTDTQYGIYVHFGNGQGGESWRMVKAETPDGVGISVGWYGYTIGLDPDECFGSDNWDYFTNGPVGATDWTLD
jgi:hypothetical protein